MKRFVQCCFLAVAVLPHLWWKVSSLFLGAERAFQGASQFCALMPGTVGALFRAAFYRLALAGSSQSTNLGFLTTFSHPGARLGKHVSSGVCCNIGLAHIGDDCILASLVCIASGKRQHGYDSADAPIRLQEGEKQLVTIGPDCWLGAGTVVLADIGEGCVVAAGSVVTAPVPPYSIVAGNPAKVVNTRPRPAGTGPHGTDVARNNAGRIMQLTVALLMGGAERIALDLLRYGGNPARGILAGMYFGPGPLRDLADAEGIESISFCGEHKSLARRIRSLFAVLRSKNVSLLHTHAEYLLPVAIPAAFLARVPLIHTMHSKHALETIPRLQRFMRFAAFCMRDVVCVSEPLRSYCVHTLGFAPDKVRVIRNGVDTERFTPNGDKAPLPWDEGEHGLFVFGNVARLHEAKDLGTLVRAFSAVHARHPETRLLLVGEGSERPMLEALVRDLDLDRAVCIAGLRTDIPRILRGLDLFVLSSRHEGMPMAVLEAMACGVPVLSTDVGAIAALNEKKPCVALAPPENSAALAEKMEWLMREQQERRTLAVNGLQRVLQDYGAKAAARAYYALYAQRGVSMRAPLNGAASTPDAAAPRGYDDRY